MKKKVRIDLYANDVTFKRMEDNLRHLNLRGKDALEYILTERDPRKNKQFLILIILINLLMIHKNKLLKMLCLVKISF